MLASADRAVDSSGATLDFLLSAKQDAAAAKRFLTKALARANHPTPRVINTDKHAAYPPAIVQLKDEGVLDHLRLKLAPLEQSGNRWGEEHQPSLSGQTSKLATLPDCPSALLLVSSVSASGRRCSNDLASFSFQFPDFPAIPGHTTSCRTAPHLNYEMTNRSLRRSRSKAVDRHFEVLVFAVGCHDRIDLLLNLFYGRAFPDADALGAIVSGGMDREFEGRRDALFQGFGYGFLETGRIVDVVNGDNVHRVTRFYWGLRSS